MELFFFIYYFCYLYYVVFISTKQFEMNFFYIPIDEKKQQQILEKERINEIENGGGKCELYKYRNYDGHTFYCKILNKKSYLLFQIYSSSSSSSTFCLNYHEILTFYSFLLLSLFLFLFFRKLLLSIINTMNCIVYNTS